MVAEGCGWSGAIDCGFWFCGLKIGKVFIVSGLLSVFLVSEETG